MCLVQAVWVSDPGEMILKSLQAMVLAKFDMHVYISEMTPKELEDAIREYGIPLDLHPQLPLPDLTMDKLPSELIGIYVEQMEQGVHPSGLTDGGDFRANTSEFRFVPDWGLWDDLRIFTYRACKEPIIHLATPAEGEFLRRLSNIDVVHQAYVSLGFNFWRAAGVAKEDMVRQRLVREFVPDVVHIEGSKTWKAKHRELFTKSYPLIQKVSDSYRLLFDSLMKLIPDDMSFTPARDGAADNVVMENPVPKT
nr:hypothetical protein [Tanacetum cinerariifolium]